MENQTTNLIIEREEIEKTPFLLVTHEDGSFIALGNYRISENYETKAEALNYINTINWDNLFNVMVSLVQYLKTVDVSAHIETEKFKI
jgi:hypothetical protein